MLTDAILRKEGLKGGVGGRGGSERERHEVRYEGRGVGGKTFESVCLWERWQRVTWLIVWDKRVYFKGSKFLKGVYKLGAGDVDSRIRIVLPLIRVPRSSNYLARRHALTQSLWKAEGDRLSMKIWVLEFWLRMSLAVFPRKWALRY